MYERNNKWKTKWNVAKSQELEHFLLDLSKNADNADNADKVDEKSNIVDRHTAVCEIPEHVLNRDHMRKMHEAALSSCKTANAVKAVQCYEQLQMYKLYEPYKRDVSAFLETPVFSRPTISKNKE